jgi:hypothetical protein
MASTSEIEANGKDMICCVDSTSSLLTARISMIGCDTSTRTVPSVLLASRSKSRRRVWLAPMTTLETCCWPYPRRRAVIVYVPGGTPRMV